MEIGPGAHAVPLAEIAAALCTALRGLRLGWPRPHLSGREHQCLHACAKPTPICTLSNCSLHDSTLCSALRDLMICSCLARKGAVRRKLSEVWAGGVLGWASRSHSSKHGKPGQKWHLHDAQLLQAAARAGTLCSPLWVCIAVLLPALNRPSSWCLSGIKYLPVPHRKCNEHCPN